MTRFGRRDEKLPDLMAEAALAAMADAGIDRPDAVVVAAMNPEEFTGEGNYGSLIATRLGLSHVPALRVETATSSGAGATFAPGTAGPPASRAPDGGAPAHAPESRPDRGCWRIASDGNCNESQ